jgi:hypothetical protein
LYNINCGSSWKSNEVAFDATEHRGKLAVKSPIPQVIAWIILVADAMGQLAVFAYFLPKIRK